MRLFSALQLFFFLPVSISLAQESDLPDTWSLEACINYALENNIQIQSSALQSEINRNNLSTAKWDYAPSLTAFSNSGWNFGLNIDPVTNLPSRTRRFTSSLNLSSNWVLYDGGRKYKSIARNNQEYLAGLYDLEAVKNDIRLNVTGAFLQILLNREILAVAQEQENLSRLQVERTRKLVEAGSAPRGDLLQFEAQLARDEQNSVSTANALMISRLQLANLLQLEQPGDFNTVEPELELPGAGLLAYDPDAVFNIALENQPNIKAAEARIESSQEAVEISQGGYLPTVSLQGQVSTSYSDQILEASTSDNITFPVPVYDAVGNVIFVPNTQTVPGGFEAKPFSDQLSDNIRQYVGLNLSVPIFNQFQVKNNVQNSRVQYELSRLQLKQEKNQLRQSIYQAHADAKASYNSFLAAEKSVSASAESFAYAQERFELGAINQFDYENAKNSLAIARSEMLRTKYDYIFKLKVLEFYLTNQVKL